jgi:hypothetical protein
MIVDLFIEPTTGVVAGWQVPLARLVTAYEILGCLALEFGVSIQAHGACGARPESCKRQWYDGHFSSVGLVQNQKVKAHI